MLMMEHFELIKNDTAFVRSSGFAEQLRMGQVQTPVFMPVGTSGAVKGITPEQLKETRQLRLFSQILIICICGRVWRRSKSLAGFNKFMAWELSHIDRQRRIPGLFAKPSC